MRHTGLLGTSSARRATAGALGALLVLGASGLTAAASAAPTPRTAVIVQLTPGSDAAAEARQAAARGGTVSFVYTSAFTGFAGQFTDQAITGLQHNPHVALIERDGVMTASDTQANPTWGLDRIDQRNLPLSKSYSYPPAAGSGVTAYVVDTGLIATDDDLKGRVSQGADFVGDGKGTVDCNGHGTHVSGTIAGTDYGVAKAATVVPVRVLDCGGSGSWSGVIAGLNWVAANHVSGPAVANMSLGGGASSTVDSAVQGVIADGVTVAVAAGNSSGNACSTSPARVPEALTVGATDSSDRRASFSNYGSCLDLFAPGVGITSDWLTGTNTISGTSMASPHVAGAAAVLLSLNPGLAPAAVASTLVTSATANVVKLPGRGSPNRLLYSAPPA